MSQTELMGNIQTSIWGNVDVLNTTASSLETTNRVSEQIYSIRSPNIWVGVRMFGEVGKFQSPLMAFGYDPHAWENLQPITPTEEMATAISGPLTINEATAAGYVLETAEVAQRLLEGDIQLLSKSPNPIFQSIINANPGKPRFVPLGQHTFLDYLRRMVVYRDLRKNFDDMDLDEDDPEDMNVVVGQTFIPLASAFREDGYKVGPNFQAEIDTRYCWGRQLFIPFAGIFDHPRTPEDHALLGIGLSTATKLFRKIEFSFSHSDWNNQPLT